MKLRFQTAAGRVTLLTTMTGGFGLALVIFLVVASVCPEWHICGHHHSDDGDDHCVITTFAAGEGFSPMVPVAIAPEPVVLFHLSKDRVQTEIAIVDLRLLPSRGPPARRLPA